MSNNNFPKNKASFRRNARNANRLERSFLRDTEGLRARDIRDSATWDYLAEQQRVLARAFEAAGDLDKARAYELASKRSDYFVSFYSIGS